MRNKNPNSILLLYEGDTEKEFYRRMISNNVPNRRIRISYDNLKGISTNINSKVIAKIKKHLENNPSEDNVNVFLGIDREGDRTNESPIDINHILKTLSPAKQRIAGIIEILATQDLESWLFIDIEGIFNFLRVPRRSRNPRRFQNIESFNHRNLSYLFRQYKRVYSKGHRVEGLLESLDLNKIYEECPDLREGIQRMIDLI